MHAFTHGTTYTDAGFRVFLALWTAASHRPFNIVNDPYLIRAFRMLNDRVQVPSAQTLSRDVKDIFKICGKKVKLLLNVSLLCLCIDHS